METPPDPARSARLMADGLRNLFDATLRGDLALIRGALRAGADVNARDDVFGGLRASPEEWQARVEGPVRINEFVRFGRTPLLHAASAGQEALVRELIDVGADVV